MNDEERRKQSSRRTRQVPTNTPAGIARRVLERLRSGAAFPPATADAFQAAIDNTPPDGDPRLALLESPRMETSIFVATLIDIEGHADWVCPGFRLVEWLGDGATGTVYRAIREEDQREVAIKLMHDSVVRDPQAYSRLQREIEVARRLSHPGLPWYGVFGRSRSGTPFIEMELLAGRTIDAAGSEPCDEETGWRVLGQLGRVLAHLRDQGVVHRDIKPSNIVLAPDSEGRPDRKIYLCDLGVAIAPRESPEITGPGDVIGTPLYMAPEQVHGDRRLTVATDIYSLGASVYRLVCGAPPFEGGSPVKVMRAHAADPIPDPRDRNPALSAVMALTLMRMLEKDPSNRPRPSEIFGDAEAALGETTRLSPRGDMRPKRTVTKLHAWPWVFAALGGAALIYGLLWLSAGRS